jgi:hypothetical protein
VHLAGVLTADQLVQLYVDGESVATVKSPGSIIADPNDAMEIGADDGSTVGAYLEPSAFDGAIDEVRIFHGTVTADEIVPLARAPAPDGRGRRGGGGQVRAGAEVRGRPVSDARLRRAVALDRGPAAVGPGAGAGR